VATFRLRLRSILDLTAQRMELERWVDALLGEHRRYRLLQMIPGIGPVFALTILAEAGDLRRFAHHRQFLKFSGLNLAKSPPHSPTRRTRVRPRQRCRIELLTPMVERCPARSPTVVLGRWRQR
jgi:transposase